MGEVYRARDRKLDRDVAIKVLPEQFSRDKERVARFEREAKLLASLNHPNIASIYGFEQSEGMHYLILELVDGETLAERIARGSIPVEELLDIAIQIADALEEAHEKGVIHRDLKPANIKLTPDGKVKVLDFGLAKAFADETLDADSSMSPTITRDATRVGVILGTAAYMSPEQARGKSVDKRSDIFAFGSVLYEMLTGKKAFPGEGVSDVLASVIKLEPDWSGVALTETSPRLRELLHRCLEKNPKKRRDIGDVRNELVELTGEAGALGSDTEVVSRSSALWTFGAVFATGALVAGLVATFVGTPASSPSAVRRLTLELAQDRRIASSSGGFAVSPDGGSVVFSAGLGRRDSRLYLRSMDSFEATALDDTEDARNPFYSPDGEWVGFSSGGKLRKARVAGSLGVLEPVGSATARFYLPSIRPGMGAQVSTVSRLPGERRCDSTSSDCRTRRFPFWAMFFPEAQTRSSQAIPAPSTPSTLALFRSRAVNGNLSSTVEIIRDTLPPAISCMKVAMA